MSWTRVVVLRRIKPDEVEVVKPCEPSSAERWLSRTFLSENVKVDIGI
jgi:hypothetical protein